MKERFKKIPGYERYSVSNYGRIINNKTGKTISQRISTNGYLRVNLRTGKIKYEKPHVVSVHRLVAEAFIPNKNHLPMVNHKDADKKNNHVNNLEWCTSQENSIHAYTHIKGYPEQCKANIKKAQEACRKPIAVYKNGKFIGQYESKTMAAQVLGIHVKTIYNNLHGMKNRQGYEFVCEEVT